MTQATLAWASVEAFKAQGQGGSRPGRKRLSQGQLGVSGAAMRDWRSPLWGLGSGPAEQMVFFTQREPTARGGTGQLAFLHPSVLIVVFCWKIHFQSPFGLRPRAVGSRGCFLAPLGSFWAQRETRVATGRRA